MTLLGLAACRPQGNTLPRLDATLDGLTVSGISSGAYMAGQFQMAHGRLVTGAAIVAGGPYGCAESVFADLIPGPGTAFLNLSRAINGCMLDALQAWGVPDPASLARRAERWAAQNRIDPIESVRSDRIYLFSGTRDRTVASSVVQAAATFYRELGVPPGQVRHVTNIAAAHAFVTEDKGQACERAGEPYIVHCNYDQAGDLLGHLLGPLQPRAAEAKGELLVFDQREAGKDLADHGLADEGLVYVPAACRARVGCRIHIAFHGCGQSRASIGDQFARETGFARWADSNRLIVLFPQVAPATLNPQACWDWWGYTGREYLTREAPQIRAVRRMLDQLAGKPFST